MKLSIIAAVSENGIIGSGLDIPWKVKGEQLLFKALTYNQWLLVGRKTFESMGKLPDRKYLVVSRSETASGNEDVLFFTNTEEALHWARTKTDHLFVSGGGEIYKAMLPKVSTVHLSRIHAEIEGDVYFPDLPAQFSKVFEQPFHSNIDYTWQIWQKR